LSIKEKGKMKMNMTKKSKIAIGLVIALLMVTTVVAVTQISNTWTSPYITVSPILLSLSSSDLIENTPIQPEVPMQFHMTLKNTNTAYSYAGVHVMLYIYDWSDNYISLADVTIKYYDPTAVPQTEENAWKTITFIQGDAYAFIFHDWAAYGFTMPPGEVTFLFRVTYHTPGIYYAQAYAVQ
jgi:hypothetical protein